MTIRCSLSLFLITLAGCGLPEDAPAWEEVLGGAPPARWGHAAAYDAARERMLVFGGDQSRGQRNDVWALDLDAMRWSEVVTTGAPGPRSDLAEVIDVARDRWLVIGGRVGLGRSIDEVWALDLRTSAWTQLPAGPSARHDVSAVTDGERAWVFGGAGDLGQSLDDLWELDLATDTWSLLPDGGRRPTARTSYALVLHDGAIWLHGGHDIVRAFHDTWRYDLERRRWEEIEVEGRAAANAHAGHALDEECGTLMLSGGDELDGYVTAASSALVLGDARMVRVPASVLPPPRDHATLVIDGSRRMILYGGGALGEGLDTHDDTWVYPLGACP